MPVTVQQIKTLEPITFNMILKDQSGIECKFSGQVDIIKPLLFINNFLNKKLPVVKVTTILSINELDVLTSISNSYPIELIMIYTYLQKQSIASNKGYINNMRGLSTFESETAEINFEFIVEGKFNDFITTDLLQNTEN